MLRIEVDVTPKWWPQANSDDVAATVGYLLRLFQVYEVHATRDRLFLSRNLPRDADLAAIDDQRKAIVEQLDQRPPLRPFDDLMLDALKSRSRHG